MISLSPTDILIILSFFSIVLFIGFLPGKKQGNSNDKFLLGGRKLGLFLFVLTNVATWYGGILGVGEFTYKYGIVSWVVQGLPYYIFAILFAIFFASKVRESSLFTIPEKLTEVYGKKVGIAAALLIFILVSPAPYLLMLGSLISLIFGLNLLLSIFIGVILSVIYLFVGGYKSDVLTDAFEFFVMFIGFGILLFAAISQFGSIEFLEQNLPTSHLQLTGDTSPIFIIVWFLIALWTFTDPGFHQRCYAAKNGNVAKWGIIISIFFWALFDFLTTTTGLFSRAVISDLTRPVLAFPMLAEKVLGSGLKGLFYAALFATILSTLNSFMFLSATTFSKDLSIYFNKHTGNIVKNTRIGLLLSSLLAVILAFTIDSVIQIWYTIGSLCIPGLIVLIASSYYPRFKVSSRAAFIEIISASLSSLLWLLLRENIQMNNFFSAIEPMIIGLIVALLIHITALKLRQ